MKTNLLILTLTMFGFSVAAIIGICKHKSSDYENILNSDKDDIYTKIQAIYEQKNESQFEKMAYKILDKDNNNLLSIAFIAQFINDHKINCKFRHVMTLKLEQLANLALDSQWQCPVSGKTFSTPGVNNTSRVNLIKAIENCQEL